MGELLIREAVSADLPRIIELTAQLLDDPSEVYADSREAYDRAYAEIVADTRQTLFVAERGGAIVGSLVLVVVPNLGRHGRPYAILENIVTDGAHRSTGVGEAMVRHAIALAEDAGCYKVSLTSRLHRADAHRFYERLGFRIGSHGFRIDLPAKEP
jgi:ribosomal protein S18 acetylase RimI-like enzyme